MTYMLRDIYFTEAACSYCINWVLFCWFFVCFVVVFFVLFCLFVRLFVLSQTSSLTLRRRQHDPNADSFLLFFCFETDETVTSDSFGLHRNFAFGTWDRYPHDCDEKRGGGWWYSDTDCAVWSNLNGIYFDNKTSRAIFWANLGAAPEESIPKSAEMKIRSVDFFSSFSRYIDWKPLSLFRFWMIL